MLDLDKTVDAVFLVASDAIMDASSDDVSPDAYYDDELKGTINFNPANNDTESCYIREDLDCILASMTVNDVNIETVFKSFFIDALQNSYNNGIVLNICCMGVLLFFCLLMQGSYFSKIIQNIYL